MDKGDKTGIAGTAIGVAVAVSSVAAAFLFPNVNAAVWTAIFWGSLGIALCFSLFLFDLHALSGKKKFFRVFIPTAVLFLFAALVCFVEWPKNSAAAANSLDYKISFSCVSVLPSAPWPGVGYVYVYELGAPPSYGVKPPDAGEDFLLPAGYSMAWDIKSQSLSVSKCTVSNYSDVTLLGVTATLPTSFIPWEKAPNGMMGGTPITGRYLTTPPLTLAPDASPQNSQSFYISNPTKFVVVLPNPNEIQFTLAGTTERQTAKLIPSGQPNPVIWPDMMPTNFPSSPHPIPTPSAPQEKTTPQTPPSPAFP